MERRNEGAYYEHNDYLGVLPRIAILVVDWFMLFLVYAASALLLMLIFGDLPWQRFLLFACLFWAYFGILRWLGFGTIGYFLAKARIVNLRAERPSLIRLTFQSLLWLFGPFNLLVDILWAFQDVQRQTLTDRLAGLMLVKSDATPAGSGEMRYARLHAWGLNLIYAQVSGQGQRRPWNVGIGQVREAADASDGQ